MKKFVFTLDKVLDYNKMVYERERNELSKLRSELRELEEQLHLLVLTLEEKSRTFKERMKIGVTVDELRQFQYLKENYEEQIKETNRLITLKRIEVESQLRRVVTADQDVKKMEKLKENQLEEYMKADQKENQEFILESVSRNLVK